MPWYDKVAWQEGMFLQAQHFQQQDRHTAHRLEARVAPLRPYSWGLTELVLDRDLLAAGKFSLSQAAGTLPDGTPFAIPGTAEQPRALDLPDGLRGQMVYLALPVQQAGSHEMTEGEGVENMVARYAQHSFEAPDTHSDSPLLAKLAVARPRLRFMLESEPRDGFTTLALARVVEVQADRRVVVDERHIPPCLRIGAAPVLLNLVQELSGMLAQRAEALARLIAQPGTRGVAEVADFLMLQALNRWLPLLRHWAEPGTPHPETLYAALAQMAGELATFTAPDKRASLYPPYRHDDLQRSFAPVVADLRRSLAFDMPANAVEIPLVERGHVRIGAIADRSILRAGQFVLSVSAEMPDEALRRLFPQQVKVGAVERIRELVMVALPGIGVRPLPVAPRQIPFHAGATYFELDRNSLEWPPLNNSGGFAIHVSGEFPNLRLSLWAIRG